MARDMITLRGQGRVECTLQHAGAREVKFEGPQGQQTVPAWRVSAIEPAEMPAEWLGGRVAISDGRFEEATAAWDAMAGSGHRFAAWAGFQAWNARRQRAELSGRGLDQALAAGETWLEQHPDDWNRAPALFMQGVLAIEAAEASGHVTERAERFRVAERCLQALAEDQAFGPVWALYAKLGRARLGTFQKGVEAQVPRAFEAVRDEAEKTELAREVAQMAEAWLARWRLGQGDARGLLRGLPRTQVDGQDLPAVLGSSWLGSPAAPVLLNAIGEALTALDATAGPVAALPFHLRVTRYFPSQHVEHARALALSARGLVASGNTSDGEALRELLRARYPESRWATPVAQRRPGD